MQETSTAAGAAAIQVPQVDSDEPVAVVPVASAAPLEDSPAAERINIFAVTPAKEDGTRMDPTLAALSDFRETVLGKPLTYAAAAFSLGFLIGRVLR